MMITYLKSIYKPPTTTLLNQLTNMLRVFLNYRAVLESPCIFRQLTSATMDNYTFLSIIPARGLSKRLKGKNNLVLGDMPLFAWTLYASLKSNFISQTLLSSEDKNILSSARKINANAIIERPLELSGDKVQCNDVVLHALDVYEKKVGEMPDYVVLLQPTSPFRSNEHIEAAIRLIINNPKANSCISITKSEQHPSKMLTLTQDRFISPFLDNESFEKQSQDLETIYRQNGAIYIVKTKEFISNNSFMITPCIPYEMDDYSSIEIDTSDDFEYAKFRLAKKIGRTMK